MQPRRGSFAESGPQYYYVLGDLRRIAIVASTLLVGLVVLSLVQSYVVR